MMKKSFVVLILVLSSACSNPLSSGKNDPVQNFHGKNVNCNEINFAGSSVTVDQIRSITHCLNAHAEINAMEVFLDTLPDSDLTPVSDLMNDIVTKQPKTMFALKESYLRAKTTGDLKNLEQILSTLFANSAINSESLRVFQKISKPFIQTFFDTHYQTNLSSVEVLLRSTAYQRFGAEYLESSRSKKILNSFVHYLNAPDAKSTRKVYDFMNRNALGTQWSNILARKEKETTQKIAHFFEWFFSEGHYEVFSAGVRHALLEPIQCFDGAKPILNPLSTVTQQIASMNTQSAIAYLSHDVKNLYLVAQGYCEFSYRASSLIKLVDDSTKVLGFEEVFGLVKPLLNDPDFLDLLGSQASADLVKELSFVVDKHFFEDLLTLLTVHLNNPLTNDGATTATLIDDLLKPLNEADIKSTVDFLSPLFNRTESYGSNLVHTVYRLYSNFPDLHFEMEPSLRSSMITSSEHWVMHSELSAVLDLSSRLVNQSKLDGLIDQGLTYLSHLFNRGRFDYPLAQVKDPNTINLPSVHYLLEKVDGPSRAQSPCDDLGYDWVFSQYSPERASSYFQEVDSLQTCLNANQTFISARDFIQFSTHYSNYPLILNIQKKVITSLFKSDATLFLATIDDFMALKQSDSEVIRETFNLSSQALSSVKNAFLPKQKIRNALAEIVQDPLLYQVASELTDPKPHRLRSSTPTLDLQEIRNVNALVTKDQHLRHVPIAEAIKAMMVEYCPSLDSALADCDIDSDQLELYLESPKRLFQAVALEEMASSQSWLHPKLKSDWVHHVEDRPTQVAQLEYHLNPALHLFRKSPEAAQSLVTAIHRIKSDQMSVGTFIKERASRMVLIPYIYQVPYYPEGSFKKYHNRIRLKLVNDLDRLELIAINADFKAFNLISNIGMGFIRDIGLAWGDVPAAHRPSSLSSLLKSSEPKTLREVAAHIEQELSKFDVSLLQSLGKCDPREHSPIGRWLKRKFCINELFDIRARLFNLRSLVPLLAEELPESDGGFGGLEFLRDFFYSLYEANTDAERDHYANGINFQGECLDDPLKSPGPNAHCQKDLLTLVSRVTHLGLLHLAGTSVLQARDHPIDAVNTIIDRATSRSSLSEKFTRTLSSDEGLKFVQDAINYGFRSPDGSSKNLSLLTQLLAIPKDLNWLNLTLEMVPKNPHYLSQNKALLNAILSIDAESLKPWLDHWLDDSSLPMPTFLNQLSQKLNPATREDVLNLLLELTPKSPTLAQVLKAANKLPDLEIGALKREAHAWAVLFASPALASTRAELSDWSISPEFSQFCEILADPKWVEKTYNFLESMNHNPDSKLFFQSCRNFLNLH